MRRRLVVPIVLALLLIALGAPSAAVAADPLPLTVTMEIDVTHVFCWSGDCASRINVGDTYSVTHVYDLNAAPYNCTLTSSTEACSFQQPHSTAITLGGATFNQSDATWSGNTRVSLMHWLTDPNNRAVLIQNTGYGTSEWEISGALRLFFQWDPYADIEQFPAWVDLDETHCSGGTRAGLALQDASTVFTTSGCISHMTWGTAEEHLGILVAQVKALNLSNGIANSLDAKLQNAVKALDDINANNDGAAVNKLQAFINEVQAQAGNKIPQADADMLIAKAQAIIDMLTG